MADDPFTEQLRNLLNSQGNQGNIPPGLEDFISGQQEARRIEAGQAALADLDFDPNFGLTRTNRPTPDPITADQARALLASIPDDSSDDLDALDTTLEQMEIESNLDARNAVNLDDSPVGKAIGDFVNFAGNAALEAISEAGQSKFSDRGEVLGEENIIRDMRYPLNALDGKESKLPSVVSFEFFKRDTSSILQNTLLDAGNLRSIGLASIAGVANVFSGELSDSKLRQILQSNDSLVEQNYAYGPAKKINTQYIRTFGSFDSDGTFVVNNENISSDQYNQLKNQAIYDPTTGDGILPNGDRLIKDQFFTDNNTLSRYKDVRITRQNEQTKDRIFMYVPSNLQFQDNLNYADKNQNFLRNAYEAAAGNVSAVSQSIKQGFLSLASDKIGKLTGELTGTQIDLYNGLRGQLGIVDNDKNETMFEGVNRKTFSFSFNFAPTSKQEALMMQNIIQAFRFHSLPELSASTIQYLAPHEVEVKFYRSTLLGGVDVKDSFGRGARERGQEGSEDRDVLYRAKDFNTFDDSEIQNLKEKNKITLVENTEIPKIGRCLVTGIDLNYSPNSKSAFFVDGTPVQVNMTLSLTQAITMNKQFVMRGF